MRVLNGLWAVLVLIVGGLFAEHEAEYTQADSEGWAPPKKSWWRLFRRTRRQKGE